MKSFCSTLFFIVIFQHFAYSQTDSIHYEVVYRVTQVNKKTPTDTVTQNILSIISSNYMVEKHQEIFHSDTSFFLNSRKNNAVKNPSIILKDAVNTLGSDRQLLYDLKRSTLMYFRNMGSRFYTERDIPEYEFTVTDQNRNFNGYTCYKAIGASSNKQYQWEIWFCKELPTPMGLLGIKNLQGLIFEANEITTNTTYRLVSFNRGSTLFKEITLPTFATKITKEMMAVYETEFSKNPKDFIQSHLPPGVSIRIKSQN